MYGRDMKRIIAHCGDIRIGKRLAARPLSHISHRTAMMEPPNGLRISRRRRRARTTNT